MQLLIRDDDEAGFEQARDWLLSGFGRWLGDASRLSQEAADEAVSDASFALDWKFGYGDGHLGRWSVGEITEFLLRWCPRKLSVSGDDCEAIPGNIALFTDYLAAQGLLARGSAAPAVLRAAATDATAEFIAEMANPASFGLAKALLAGAADYGYDVTDEAGLAAWMERFNSLSDRERDAILPDSALGIGGPAVAPRRRSLPPVVLPPDEVIEASKAAAPVLGMFAELARFAGAGRRLTPNGNLNLADARKLVVLLGTGDVLDPRIGDQVFRTRSSAELPRLRLVFTWARKAGVVRVLHGKVVATKRGLALAGDPAGMFDKALDALLAIGPIVAQMPPGAWVRWPEVDQVIDSITIHLLVPPYTAGGPVPLADITDLATQAITGAFDFGQIPREHVTRHARRGVVMLAEAMELAGVLRFVACAADEDLSPARPGGDVELTPAGLAALRGRLAAAGYDTPTAGRLAAASAAGLVTGIDPADLPWAAAEIDAWLERRTPEQALAELADAARQIGSLPLQIIALAIMTDIGPEAAAPHIRRLADDRGARAVALCWLADHGLVAERELYDPGDLETFADVLANRLLAAEQAGVLDCLALVGDEDAQARLVSELGASPAAATEPVLQAIGQYHPAKAVAKAARKALFQRRSRLASQTMTTRRRHPDST